MKKVNDDMLPELAGIYNTEGKQELYRCLREQYGIRQPSTFFNRMKINAALGYDEQNDVFSAGKTPSDNVFMSMEELCMQNPVRCRESSMLRSDKSEEMKSLIQELIGERLLELNRYVKLDSRTRTVLIDATSLKNDGYSIVNH